MSDEETDSPLHHVPLRQRAAKEFVRQWHRTNRSPPGAVFAADQRDIPRAVAIVECPVPRHLHSGEALDATRTATEGVRNASSSVYAACWRAAQALGYSCLVTYTQEGESGASSRGVWWRSIARHPARGRWNCAARPRQVKGTENVPLPLREAQQ
ncbi:XF1762 family protein [Streptomyces sp. NPDC093249]|uniref:XF1762 family protein n=1 Tax=unclassified Streptomyces TaxID=2593676 RepID=UPI00344B2528